MNANDTVELLAPAKVNLLLAITGRRPDGFHDLVSVAAPLEFGDTLRVERADGFGLGCDDAAVPAGEDNLILRAARLFAEATGWSGGARFQLTKRIPLGAGLGGGSSDAVAALRALNGLAGEPIDRAGLAALAARLGSDCPLFLESGPVVMRGRGERIEPLPAGAAARLRGRQVLVFHPGFPIATAWAYRRMAERGGDYLPAAAAEARLAAWLAGEAPAEELLYNNMEAAAFEKHLALPVLLAALRAAGGGAVQMSGSGSACFALPAGAAAADRMAAQVRGAWGDGAWVVASRLA